MRSITGRTTMFVLVAMLIGLGGVLAFLHYSFTEVLEDYAYQELTTWIQTTNYDILDVVTKTEPPQIPLGFTILRIVQLEEDGEITELITYKNRGNYVPLVPVMISSNIGVVLVEVWSPHLQAVHRLKQGAIFGSILLVVLAILITLGTTIYNVLPLHRLIRQAHRLTKGSFEHHFEMEGSQEIEDLVNVFEQIRLRFRQVVSGAITQAMIWEGQLELFPMSQLLIMLRFTTQTGVLVIMEGNNLGRIYVQEGQVRGALYKEQRGFTAFYALFLLSKGYFKFNPKMKPFEDELLAASWYSVLLYAARRVTSLQLIEQYIPDHHFVAIKTELFKETGLIHSDLTAAEWDLYNSIDGQVNVKDLAISLQWTSERVQRYLYRFAVVGLIETQLTVVTKPSLQNVVSLWPRAVWNKKTGGN